MDGLLQQHCQPYDRQSPPLAEEALATLLSQIPGWQLASDGKSISRSFRFKNYYETLAFVNASAWISHREDHHPDLEVSYNSCLVVFSTHSVGGLSMNDFICAAKFSAIINSSDSSLA